MAENEPLAPRPLVLRVEISAEQASSLAPLLGARSEAVSHGVSEEFVADVQFREDRIERWRTELEELEQTLDRRERDIVSYVDQLQGAMANSDDAWWSRPAGGDGGVRH